MPATLTYSGAAPAGAFFGDAPVLVIGTAADVASWVAHRGAAGSAAAAAALLSATAAELKPTAYKPALATTRVPLDDGAVSASVTLAALPTGLTRHNSPARPHGVTDAAKASSLPGLGSGAAGSVVLLLADAAHAFAAGCAVARAFSTYSTKTAGGTAAGAGEAGSSVTVHAFTWANGAETSTDAAVVERISVAAERIRHTAAMVDEPCGTMHTDAYLALVREVCATLGDDVLEPTVIRGTELRDKGFGGIWGVGKAAAHPPCLIHLTYKPSGAASSASAGAGEGKSGDDGPIVIAGKGIVYDTGGLSIKGKTFMPGMKRDMGGSAAVFNTFVAAAKLKYPRELHVLLCVAENSVGPDATRPDDILTMYSGRTVEVNNTDAEGRLVLGDGVAYAVKHLNPAYLIDMATLTGAQGISTGKRHGALYCNDDDLEAIAVKAGKTSGDLTHPLPFAPEFLFPEFASAVADMKNSVKDRANAQSSCAGQFIGEHMGDYLHTGKWLHIDMAYPSFSGERATGYGVALLMDILDALK